MEGFYKVNYSSSMTATIKLLRPYLLIRRTVIFREIVESLKKIRILITVVSRVVTISVEEKFKG